MVQIGNLHIGLAEKVQETILTCGEANILWNHLETRYQGIEKTQIWENMVHDPDLKFFIRQELKNTLETQANTLEKIADKFKLPMPNRPPKSVNMEINTEIFNDKYIFSEIITSVENYMSVHLNAVRTTIFNDSLRKMFIQFMNKEMEIYDDLCKYGKIKGWFQIPPFKH